MAIIFEIEHTTTYKYANPVTFGQYRAMFLPRPASRGRLLTRCGFGTWLHVTLQNGRMNAHLWSYN